MDEAPVSRGHEARMIVKKAMAAIKQNRRHDARLLLQKALKINPNSQAVKELLSTIPELPEGLQPAKETGYHPETGLPLEAFCKQTRAAMVLVPAGKFLMGSDKGRPDEAPGREVYLGSFYIDKFEVTNGMFTAFLNARGVDEGREALKIFERSKYGIIRRARQWAPAPGYKEHPMACVTWHGAQKYAQWARLALPTEAQWEKAARGADGRLYPWGNKFSPEKCNCKQSGVMAPTPVDRYPGGVSPFGCWDVAGNVWEWCFDWYSPDYYASSPGHEPVGPPDGEAKVMRGGGWGADASAVRCCARYYAPPEIHIETLGGFRCVKLLTPRKPPEARKRASTARRISKLLRTPIIGGKKTPAK